ncbi:hypothetical protein [Methylocystis sp. ATCC 49242]|uniref:hypothetical protein n=1 Tax=Methylocystis sp. ATCC 49242 TaxID=622637 RepID=UPI0001F87357|nr:hypothetical protein [Methylocystis sp. ATCC 49242]
MRHRQSRRPRANEPVTGDGRVAGLELAEEHLLDRSAANLPSLLFNPSSNVLLPAADQTVYHITDYRGGYFWGKNVTKVGRLPVACSSLVGSVTPTGRVLLSFTSVKSDGSESVQQGFGEMVLQGHAWTMLNQTSTSSFAHWAYMVQSKPGDASWRSLPGVRQSVPDFLAQCPGSGPQIGVR